MYETNLSKAQIARLDREAASAAKKICGCGECLCAYQCNHENHSDHPVSAIGKDTTCPLAKYNITPEPKSLGPAWLRKSRSELEPSYAELAAVCAKCEFSKMKNGEVLRDDCFYDHCLDCPVYMTEESMQETAAEARSS